MIQGIFPCGVCATLPDHDRKFSLEVDLVRDKLPGNPDRGTRIEDRGRVFEEEYRKGRDPRIHLLCVLSVIQSDAEDRRRNNGGQEGELGNFLTGQVNSLKRIPGENLHRGAPLIKRPCIMNDAVWKKDTGNLHKKRLHEDFTGMKGVKRIIRELIPLIPFIPVIIAYAFSICIARSAMSGPR